MKPRVSFLSLFLTQLAALLLAGSSVDAQQTADTLPPLGTIQAQIDQLTADSSKVDRYDQVGGQLLDIYRDRDAAALTKRGLALANELGAKQNIARFQSRLGDINLYASRYPEATRFYQQSLDVATTVRDTNQMVYTLLRLGQSYNSMDEFTLSENYLLRSLQLALRNQSRHLAACYNELSILEGKRKNPAKAIEYGQQCMAINKKNNNLESYYSSLLNNAICYKNLKQYEQAVAAYQEVLAYSLRARKDYQQIMVYANLPWALIPLNRLDEAERYGRLTIQRATAGSVTNKNELLEEGYNILAETNRQRGNYRSALDYREKATAYHDSIFNAAKSQQLLELTTRYETEKKEAQIKELDAQNDRKQLQLFYVGGGAALLLVVLGLVGGLYRQLRRVNYQLADNNQQLNQTLHELKTTQEQLIQKEKMASLGELTAGIAHEIQNPLNFVNNFSELSVELADELKEELRKEPVDKDYIDGIVDDLSQNQQKINHHGKRADNIVKGMLEHSRTSTGEKQPTDLNALADEYLKLAYHGIRAKDKNFHADLVTDFDSSLKPVALLPHDMGRVLLNLCNNAFYAVQERQKQESKAGTSEGYQPTVTIYTRQLNGQSDRRAVEVRVKDNGTGMDETIKQKIFQPFFTTKPTGQGTGLGLSLSYDIVTKGHSGAMEVETRPGEGTEMVVRLPVS